MYKTLPACILAGLSISSVAQTVLLPPDKESNLQQRADAYFETSTRLCEPLRGSPLFQQCLDGAVSSRERFVANGRSVYWSVQKEQDSKKQFRDTADRCKFDTSRACSDAMQEDAEQYYEDAVDARVAASRR